MSPFQFLDLPAELRNNIYEHALYHDRVKGHLATVALLRTCKQVYEEARDFIYEGTTFCISVVHEFAQDRDQFRLKGDMHYDDILHEGEPFESGICVWPGHLQKFSHIAFNFKGTEQYILYHDVVHKLLFGLATFFAMNRATLKGLEIVLPEKMHREALPLDVEAMLYPVAKLPASTEVSYQHLSLLGEQYMNALRVQPDLACVRYNAWLQWQSLEPMIQEKLAGSEYHDNGWDYPDMTEDGWRLFAFRFARTQMLIESSVTTNVDHDHLLMVSIESLENSECLTAYPEQPIDGRGERKLHRLWLNTRYKSPRIEYDM